MFADSWQIIVSVLGVFLVIGLGAFCRKRHWLTREADRSLANLTAKVLLPSLFLDRILAGDSFDSLAVAWTPPLIGFGITSIGILGAMLLARSAGPWIGLVSDAQQRSFALCAGICNYGYIPLPLAQAFYPEAEVDLILHNVGVDLALWSVGIAVITGGSVSKDSTPPTSPARSAAARRWSMLRPALLSPPLIAVLTAATIKQLDAERYVPEMITKSIGLLSSCAVPMGLLLSGAIIIDFLREAQWKGAWRTIVAAIGYRQLWMPAVMLGLPIMVPLSADLKQVVMLQAAMPAAVFPIVLVRLYERDTATALRVVLSTSLAGVLLIPLWLAVGKWWLGV